MRGTVAPPATLGYTIPAMTTGDPDARSLRTQLRRVFGARNAPPSPAEPAAAPYKPLVTPQDRAIIDQARPYTITSEERLQSLIDAVRYCVARDLPGAFSECGTWLGGSVLAMVLTLQDLGVDDRDIVVYDTFEGMTEPTAADTQQYGPPALETWQAANADGTRPWSEYFDPDTFDEETVRDLLLSTGYPRERIRLVRGPVEETLPEHAPDELALLRLDTDWYESTRHELEHLYPVLTPGGVLIIDDFGHWDGARRAVEEYFTSHPPLLLNRIDYSGRIAVKA